MVEKILVTGASIAGNTAAYWLSRYGFEVTVVEREGKFRDGGQNIDVRGAGRDVLREMGLESEAFSKSTGEEGTAWVKDDGSVIAEFRTGDTGADGITAELEILRGDLARLIYEESKKNAQYRFGDSIKTVQQGNDKVEVEFKSGIKEFFDVILIAEGVGSSTREIVFPHENKPRWMDVLIGYFNIPSAPTDSKLWLWYHTTEGRSVSLRPGPSGKTLALLTVQKTPEGEHDWSDDEQKRFLVENFKKVGWETPRILEGLKSTDWFYFDSLRQVRMKHWSKGNVCVVGDAAWCATPIAGIGATLALVGPYILAGELHRAASAEEAFRRYESIMRPVVAGKQNIPKMLPRLMNPQSVFGLKVMRALLRVLSLPFFKKTAGKMFLGATLELALPNYSSDSLP